MHRFYLPPHAWNQPQLDEAETHHAKHVLRLQPGATITVFDGCGREASATLQEFHKKSASLRLGASLLTPRPTAEITLTQAIPKARNMDLIIQKAVELGASRIVPLITDRTIVRCSDEADALNKQERWRSIAIEACKQSGQNWLPVVEKPCSLQEFLTTADKNHLLLLASLEESSTPMKHVLTSFKTNQENASYHLTVMVGPEGDFTPVESAMARAAGYQPVSLGPIVLRTETAALYCLSVLAYEFAN